MCYKILKNLLILFFVLILSGEYYSQVSIMWELDSKKENAVIVIYNNSNQKVAIPIDTSSLQAYFSDANIIKETNWTKGYPFLAPILNIYDYDTQNRIETNSSSPYFDISEFEKLKMEKDSIQKEYNSTIEKWKSKYKIQKDYMVQMNNYLFNNLIYLKRKEKIKFSVVFNLRNITNREDGLHDSYIIEKNKKYSAFLSLQIDKSMYSILTSLQQKKLKKYKFFTGKLESNKIEFKQ